MKVPGILLLLVLSAGALPAQTDSAPIEVLSNRWRREVRNPALLDDPLVSPGMRNPDRTAKAVDLENNARLKPNRILLPDAPQERTQRTAEDATTQYVYEVKILNTGRQTIRRIDWQFDLFEPTTQQLVGHHTFTSKTNVRSGKTTKLVERSRSIPVTLVEASQSGAKPMDQYPIQVIINRIEYDGGAVWVRPSN